LGEPKDAQLAKKIPCLSLNPKVHYITHKSPQMNLNSIQSQINQAHALILFSSLRSLLISSFHPQTVFSLQLPD